MQKNFKVCGWLNNGPKRYPGPTPWKTCQCYLYSKGDFADVITLRHPGWECCPVSLDGPCHHKWSYKREAQGR